MLTKNAPQWNFQTWWLKLVIPVTTSTVQKWSSNGITYISSIENLLHYYVLFKLILYEREWSLKSHWKYVCTQNHIAEYNYLYRKSHWKFVCLENHTENLFALKIALKIGTESLFALKMKLKFVCTKNHTEMFALKIILKIMFDRKITEKYVCTENYSEIYFYVENHAKNTFVSGIYWKICLHWKSLKVSVFIIFTWESLQG